MANRRRIDASRFVDVSAREDNDEEDDFDNDLDEDFPSHLDDLRNSVPPLFLRDTGDEDDDLDAILAVAPKASYDTLLKNAEARARAGRASSSDKVEPEVVGRVKEALALPTANDVVMFAVHVKVSSKFLPFFATLTIS